VTGGHLADELLDALAHGELPDDEREAAARHASGCLRCGGALAGLRRQRRALSHFSSAHDGDIERLWSGVASQLEPGRLHLVGGPVARAAPRWRWTAAAVGACAAAGLLLALLQGGPRAAAEEDESDELTPSAQAALAQAEAEYRHAVEVVEADVRARPQAAGHEHPGPLRRARQQLALAGGVPLAGRSRVRLLENYSAYLRSLRRELDEPADGPAAGAR
jgi:hypothetical protein